MAEGKWIEGLIAERPIAEAARLALAVRLAAVRCRIDPRPAPPFADVEAVHQLRVATRRARATLDAFQLCYPKKQAKRARGTLRALRRAAGEVRDCDILILLLRALAAADVLIGFALGLRTAAQERLTKALDEHGAELLEISNSLPDLAEAPDDKSVKSFGDLAAGFEEHLGSFTNALRQTGDLHRIRIEGKWLRYSFEVFANCFEAAYREQIYPALCVLQDHLGEFQDATTAIARLESLRRLRPVVRSEWPHLQAGIAKVIQSLRAKQRTSRAKFRKWKAEWTRLISSVAQSAEARRSPPEGEVSRRRSRRSPEA